MKNITVQTSRGTFHISPEGKSVVWQSVGLQALCTVFSEADGKGQVLASFINPLSIEFVD